MLQRRTVLLFLLAVTCGLAAAWLAYNRDPGAAVASQQTGVETTPIVVAAFDIQYGDTIGAESLETVAWPSAHLPEGALTDPGEATGRLANQDIFAGEPVVARRVVDELGGSALANLIADEYRAVTVRVNDVIGVAGFLLPGNRVDIFASRQTDGGRGERETRILLQNIKVLAVDQKARTNENEPIVVRAVTLEVKPEQAEKLVDATQEGSVQLALRNPKDSAEVALEEPEPPPSRPRGPVGRSVTIIRGTSGDVSRVRQ